MAKELSALDVAAFLAAQGLEIPQELQAKIDASVSDEAFHYFSEKVILPLADDEDNAKGRKARNEKVTAWQEKSFTLAEDMVNDFRAEKKAVGRGHQIERIASIATPHGTLVMRLRQDVPESDKSE